MEITDVDDGPAVAMATLRRLEAATNAHDLDGLADCFAVDYENLTPVHPARGFIGRAQVRRNWHTIFRAVPDLKARVLDAVSRATRCGASGRCPGTGGTAPST